MRHVLALLFALGVAACAILGPPTPRSVAPTLVGWREAGISCDGPFEDGVPRGLLQWHCSAAFDSVELQATLDGDDDGVFQVTAQVPGGADRTSAMAAFADLVAATPALAPGERSMVSWLNAGGGPATTFGTTWIMLEEDPTWITLAISPGPRRSVNDPVR